MTAPDFRYRKRPVVVEARRVGPANFRELAEWCGGSYGFRAGVPVVEITTLEGTMTAPCGDWVVKGVAGEFHPVRDDIFRRTYDRAGALEGKTPGQAVYEAQRAFMIRRFPGIALIGWDELSGEAQAEWEGFAQAGVTAGGWDALAAEIESLAPGDGITVGSTVLAQVCRAVAARLTGSRPEGEVSVWIDSEGDGDAKVTVAWGEPRLAEKAARGEEPWFPGGDPRDEDWIGGYRPGIEGD